MFLTIGNVTQHVSTAAGLALLSSGVARVATAEEARNCVTKLSAPEVLKPVPNAAMRGYRPTIERETNETDI